MVNSRSFLFYFGEIQYLRLYPQSCICTVQRFYSHAIALPRFCAIIVVPTTMYIQSFTEAYYGYNQAKNYKNRTGSGKTGSCFPACGRSRHGGNRPDTRTAPQSRMHSGKARGNTARGQSCNSEKDEKSKSSKEEIESSFYEYLTSALTESEADTFAELLDKLYNASKTESRAGFPHFMKQ